MRSLLADNAALGGPDGVDQHLHFRGIAQHGFQALQGEIQGQALADDLAADFERLKARSVRWGTPEWLELRQQTMQLKGTKGMTTRTQRNVYKTLKATGLHWLF